MMNFKFPLLLSFSHFNIIALLVSNGSVGKFVFSIDTTVSHYSIYKSENDYVSIVD